MAGSQFTNGTKRKGKQIGFIRIYVVYQYKKQIRATSSLFPEALCSQWKPRLLKLFKLYTTKPLIVVEMKKDNDQCLLDNPRSLYTRLIL